LLPGSKIKVERNHHLSYFINQSHQTFKEYGKVAEPRPFIYVLILRFACIGKEIYCLSCQGPVYWDNVAHFYMFQAYGTIITVTTFHPSCSDNILVGIAEVKLFSYVCILAFLVHEGRYHRVILKKTEPLFWCFLRFVFKLFTKNY